MRIGPQHADPTANAAVGAANKEWFHMVRLALKMKRNPRMAQNPRLRGLFQGVFARLLEETPESLEQILNKTKQ